jgi:hypothetical protein
MRVCLKCSKNRGTEQISNNFKGLWNTQHGNKPSKRLRHSATKTSWVDLCTFVRYVCMLLASSVMSEPTSSLHNGGATADCLLWRYLGSRGRTPFHRPTNTRRLWWCPTRWLRRRLRRSCCCQCWRRWTSNLHLQRLFTFSLQEYSLEVHPLTICALAPFQCRLARSEGLVSPSR